MNDKRFRKSRAYGPMMLLTAQYFSKIVGPLVAIILIRYLGVEDYGLYASAMAIISFLSILPDFGLQQSALKISVDTNIKLNNLMKTTLYTSMLYTLIALVFLVIWINIFQYELTIKTLAYLLSITFFNVAFMKITTTVLQIKREYTRIALWNIISSSSQWLVTLIGIFMGLNLISVVFLPQLISLIITIIMLIFEGSRIKLFSNMSPFKGNYGYKPLVKESLEFGTANSMHQMYHRSDAMILSASRNPTEVGFFSAAFKVAELVYFFAGVLFNQVLYPIFFKWSRTNREKYLKYYVLLNKIMLLLGFFSTIIILLFSEELMYIIFGSQELFSSNLLKIMILAVPFRYIVISTGAILTTDNLVRERIKIQSKIAIINVGSNALLVPIYGAFAAAILIVITDILLMIGYVISINKHVTKKHFSKINYIQLPILVGLVATMFYFSHFSILYKVLIAIVICFIFLVLSVYSFEKDEIDEMKSHFKKQN